MLRASVQWANSRMSIRPKVIRRFRVCCKCEIQIITISYNNNNKRLANIVCRIVSDSVWHLHAPDAIHLRYYVLKVPNGRTKYSRFDFRIGTHRMLIRVRRTVQYTYKLKCYMMSLAFIFWYCCPLLVSILQSVCVCVNSILEINANSEYFIEFSWAFSSITREHAAATVTTMTISNMNTSTVYYTEYSCSLPSSWSHVVSCQTANCCMKTQLRHQFQLTHQ